ncbi:MAG: hypothetical protein KBI34_00485 [Dictyoglomi bacterium]|nr:hypothetical protein [Dictyoglomota bacterium]HHV80484.1 hypothetical protein [bacterium]
MLKDELALFVKEAGLDLVGIAPIERFKDLPPERHPSSIFPEAKTVVVLAQEIPRGTFRGIEEGTLWTRAPRKLAPRYVYSVARFLEDRGWEGVPLLPISPERWPDGIPVSKTGIAPNVSTPLEYAAVAAGLGEIGFCRIFLTPQFGPRQSLGIVITDAPIEEDPLFNGTVCDRKDCLECVNNCPLNAIDKEDVETITILEKQMECGRINFKACRLCPNGVYLDESWKESVPNRLTASCVRACIAHLETTERITKRYNTPFRVRESWKLGIFDV